ncbi:MAG: sigma 54-interacting transcriptional regulator [Leptospiraceae bacterium]|nr:sigma 54-interacting transcriptional regulator [Leptospiraceae bacterium]
MNSTLDPDQLLDLILDHCIKICQVESGSLMLVNQKDSILEIVTYRGHKPEIKSKVKLKLGEGITGLVASTGKPFLTNDVTKEPNYVAIKNDLKSELAVPMIVEDNVIGVISLDSSRADAFTEDQMELVSILANQAALIFKNLTVFRKLEQKNKIQQVLIDISKIVTSTLDLDEIFQSIIATMDKSLKLERGSLVLYEPPTGMLRLVAAVGLTQEEMEKGTYQPGEGITGKVYETGEAVYIHSIADDPNFLDRVGYLQYFKNNPKNVSLLCVPVKSEISIIGVISVFGYNQKNTDTQTSMDFLQVVASMIYQAIKIHDLVDEAKKEISRENILLKRELREKYKFGAIIGKSKQMEKLFEKIKLVSESKASVLITGESGTGKEMIASAIHYNSNRSDKPFIKINCAAIPEYLLESELFGHTKGSFTGAFSDKKGKFEVADGGTIFLDEIGELDLNLQAKLLRVLQEKEIEAVGSLKVKKVDVRILAATNSLLETAIAEKKFRSDLYYRLNVVNMEMPPLRDRQEDIPLLVSHFIDKYNKENSKSVKGISRDAHKLLQNYQWPGNVRELENMIERAIVLSQSDNLDVNDFIDILEKTGSEAKSAIVQNSNADETGLSIENTGIYSNSFLESLEGRALEVITGEVESRLIHYAMKKFRYTKTRVAKYLGINRNTLDKRIKELKIEY